MATDHRGHTVPIGAAPARRQDLLDLSMSINDIVPVANATARAQALVDIGSSSTKPLYVLQRDIGHVLWHDGTRWRRHGDQEIASASAVSTTLLATGSTSWTTVASQTVTTLGGPVLVRGSVMLVNANSGAFRWASVRLLTDSTAHAVVIKDIALHFISGGSPGAVVSWDWPINSLAAGSHTFALQGQGSAATSVQCTATSLVVIEKP